MKLSLYSSIAWQHPFGLAKVIERAAASGWDGISIRGSSLEGGTTPQAIRALGFDMMDPERVPPSVRDELKQRLEEHSLSLVDVSCYVPLTGPTPEAHSACVSRVFEYVDLAAALGARWLRLINQTPLPPGPRQPIEKAMEYCVNGLRRVAEYAANSGIQMQIENNENTVIHDATTVRYALEAVGPNLLSFAFDPANLYMSGGDVHAAIPELVSYCSVTHVKNVSRVHWRDAGYAPGGEFGYVWRNLDDGDLSWQDLIQRLVAHGFDGWLLFEYANPFKGMSSTYWGSLPRPQEAAEHAARILRNFTSLRRSSA